MFMSSLVGKTHEMPMNCFHRHYISLHEGVTFSIHFLIRGEPEQAPNTRETGRGFIILYIYIYIYIHENLTMRSVAA